MARKASDPVPVRRSGRAHASSLAADAAVSQVLCAPQITLTDTIGKLSNHYPLGDQPSARRPGGGRFAASPHGC